MDLFDLYLFQMYLLTSRKVAFAVCYLLYSSIHLTGPSGQEWGTYLNSKDLSSRRDSHFYETI